MHRRRAAAAMVVVVAAAAAPAIAARVEPRLTLASTTSSGAPANGASTRPSLSSDGRLLAFESAASNLVADGNGAIVDVFLRDLVTGAVQLVSAGPGGAAGDGPSGAAVVARTGAVVFTSVASNLVAGDGNGARDVFVRAPDGVVSRVSLTHQGGEANGPSYEPDVSEDGRFVVFTSRADNLVPGDDNGVEDVFLHDIRHETTRRVTSTAPRGRTRAPSISPDGGWISFESTAANLVAGDTNGVADVFLAERETGRLRRVSVSTRGVQQNRAVLTPFVTVSDVSRGGRHVAWDSDATNLVPGDRNRDTDVFVRDVIRNRTELVSIGATGRQGDNDSYFPAISSDGRLVTFSSYAGNLFPGDATGEDVFMVDRERRAATVLTATEGGRRRPRERSRQLLRRAPVVTAADRVAFTSTARLTGRVDAVNLEDVLLRSFTAPQGRVVEGPRGTVRTRRPRLKLSADDPLAKVFVCRLDGRRMMCPRRLPRLRRGRHTLSIWAGGAGMRFDPTPVRLRFRVR